ncbi:hypothetical protein C1707_14805 [Caulobacter flavus]|uniref:Flagellar motor switch protein FliG n=1 Tax=Caulobacter flavus TaxID=1679497 RepID=A0ABM6ZZU0_9CAUL|nr:hypothetical protein C1707_14805 [Caulobacter flavus]
MVLESSVFPSVAYPSVEPEAADLLITSIGHASPRAASVLSQALELPVETVVDALYRAPARLLANLPAADAARLAALIGTLGVEASVTPAGGPVARAPAMDLAAELLDLDAADAVAATLGRFLGMDPAAALDLLLTPPGVILGAVTEATVRALETSLPAGAVRLTASRPDQARFALFASDLSHQQVNVLRQRLPAGADLSPGGSATVFDLDRSEADALWRRLKAPEQVRIVDQAFLRFSLELVAAPPEGAAALEALAGVPAEDFDLLRRALPVPVEAGVAFDALESRLAAYAEAGLTVRAELETFSYQALDVLSAPAATLAELGLPGPAPLTTGLMPRPRARLLRHRLEAAGAEVLFSEARA